MIKRSSFFVAGVLCLLVSVRAPAQTSEECRLAVSHATEQYRAAAFEEVTALVGPCVEAGLLNEVEARQGYRLLALSQLQTGDIANARLAVLRLIILDPLYEADPVQDLPSYVALVQSVREQLDDPRFADRIEALRQEMAAISPPPEALRDRRQVYLFGMLGISSYGGERGREKGSALAEFASNGGPSFRIGAGYNMSRHFAFTAQYDVSRYATLLHQKSDAFAQVRPGDSSSWLHAITAGGMVRILPEHLATPYLSGGVGLVLGRINDSIRSGFATDLAIGVETMVSRDVAIDGGLGLRFVFPGDAVDLVDRTGSSDLFPVLRAGVSWRLGRL